MQVVLTAAVVSGDIVLVGSKVCVALISGAIGDTITVMNEGVFEHPKAAGAITQGQKLYYDGAAKKITTTAAGNAFAGYGYIPAASGDATAQLLLVDNPSDPGYVQVAVQADSVAATVGDLVTDFNALLAKLKAAGVMASA